MAIYAKAPKKRVPAPAGLHRAVCVDVIDKGLKTGQFGTKPKVVLVFELEELHPDFGTPYRVSQWYTNSLHEKAILCQHLESWRGRAFTEEEKPFDLERLIGVPCLLNVVHRESNGTTYADVAAILPMPKGQEPLQASGHYVRVVDRDDQPPGTQDDEDNRDDQPSGARDNRDHKDNNEDNNQDNNQDNTSEGQIDDLDLPF